MSSTSTSSRNFISMANKYDRVVLLVDMDCFYCQVEEKLDPSLKGQPLAVVQYNAWRGGGIIAVNYAGRAKGVTRHMRGDEAKEQCPEIVLVKVPNVREKADLTKYREAGKDVANVLQRFTSLLERASVDEAYLDITDTVNKRITAMNEGTFVLQPNELVNTYAVGFETIGEFVTNITTRYTNPLLDNDDFYRNFQESDIPAVRQSNIRLLIGASIASEIRAAVKAETEYECSAGIAHNKILAKLACGLNKPNKQTLLPLAQIGDLFATLPVGKIKGLGAKYGEEVCERLGIRYLGQLLKFTEMELQRKFDEKNGSWLYNICRGIDLEAVTPRFYSKSIGCCKKFPGRNNITGLRTLQHWLKELSNEISDRLDKDIIENNRRAKQMVVNFIQEFNGEEISSSRSALLSNYDTEMLARNSLEIIKTNTKLFFRPGSDSVLNNPIKFLGISVGKFETISNSQNNIQEMFAQQAAKKIRVSSNITLASANDTNHLDEETNTTIILKSEKAEESNSQNNIKEMFAQQAAKKNRNSSDVSALTTTGNDTLNNETVCNPNLNVKPEKTDNSKELAKNKNKTSVKSFFVKAMQKQNAQSPKVFHNNDNIEQPIALDGINYESSFPQSSTKSSFKNKFKTTEADNNEACSTSEPIDKSYSPVEGSKSPSYLLKEFEHTSVNLSDISESTNTMERQQNSFFTKVLKRNIDRVEPTTIAESKHIDMLEKTNSCGIENSCSYLNGLIEDLETIDKGSDDAQRLSVKRKFSDISSQIETHQKDYRTEYAEFATPEFRPQLLQFTNCPTCAAKIPNDPISIQMHQDQHFAQLLSQQQRQEFREEVRSKINTTKSSPNYENKKPKKSPTINSNTKSTMLSITKFLKPPPTQIITKDNEISEAGKEICDICKLPVKLDELSEHKDYHVAKDLQRKLNQLEVRTVEVIKKPVGETSRRNLNTTLAATSRPTKVAVKPITQFFTQPST